MKKRIITMLIAIFCLLAFSSCETETDSLDVRLEDSDILRVLDGKIVFADMWTQMIFTEPESDDFNFELHTQHGGFFIGDEPYPEGSPDRFVNDYGIQGAGSVCWTFFYGANYEWNERTHNKWYGKQTFIEVIINQGEQCVGYAVIKVERESSSAFYMTILECKITTAEEAAEKGLTKEQLQAIIDEIVEKNS